jgi:hypothetical protein
MSGFQDENSGANSRSFDGMQFLEALFSCIF